MIAKLAATLALFVAVPMVFHRPLALVGAVTWGALGLWQLRAPMRRLMPLPAWAVFIAYQLGICVLCHYDLVTHTGCIVLTGMLWGLGVPLWIWEMWRMRKERRAMADLVRSELRLPGSRPQRPTPGTD